MSNSQSWLVHLGSTLDRLGIASPVDLFATCASLGMAGVLLWAGAEKLRNLDPTAKVVVHLGLPDRAAWPAALLLALTEVTVAVGLVWYPGSYLAVGVVSGLAVLFAAAGWSAIRSGKRIHCSCFGSRGAGYLGITQIIALPIWICGSLLVVIAAPGARSLESTVILSVSITMSMAMIRTPGALRAVLQARGDRLTAMEMRQWSR